jgi:hypothetical protein
VEHTIDVSQVYNGEHPLSECFNSNDINEDLLTINERSNGGMSLKTN